MGKKLHRMLIATLVVIAMMFTCLPAFAATPLKITKQPVSVTVSSGTTAKVDVDATGDGLTYKWYYKNKGDKKFSLTTSFKSDSYSVKMSSSRAGRQVYCVIKDKSGESVKTNTATLSMGTTLKVSTQPKSVTVAKGKTAKVSFAAKGDGLKYKWYYKNKGASKFKSTTTFKGTTYSVKMSADRDGRQVYCKITDKYGSSIKTKTVTLNQKKTAKVTKQPVSVNVAYGENATVKFTAIGDGLTYKWYYQNAGSSSFSSTSSFKGNTYSVEMNKDRNGRKVYCKITDKYGNTKKTNTVSLNMTSVYFITVNDGAGKYIVGVDESGKYALETPSKEGYKFAGWKTTKGSEFASSGTISADASIVAVWEVADTKTLSQLTERVNAGINAFNISDHINIYLSIYLVCPLNAHDIQLRQEHRLYRPA